MCYTASTKPEVHGEDAAGGLVRGDSVTRSEVEQQLARLLASPAFAGSARRSRLLRYLVGHALENRPDSLTEYAIGVDVFDKPASFDPRIESIVRTEAGRLRQKLREYYAAGGSPDPVRVELPLRSYRPVFSRGSPAAPCAPASSRRKYFPASIAILCLVGIGAAVLTAGLWRSRTAGGVRSLAVLPFQNLSSNSADEYLSDGLTDELTNEFANWKDLRVVARTSAYQYKNRGVDVRKIGRDLNVDAVIEGSLMKQGDRVRITAQLNRTSDGYHLWSRAYDMQALDMLTVQRQIAQAIAAEVKKLGGKTAPRPVHTTRDPEALDLYLRGSYQYSRLNPESLRESLVLFQAALAKDPGYVRAHIGLAMAEMELMNFSTTPDRMADARSELLEAVRLDPDAGDAHWLLAEIIAGEDRDWPHAEREFKLAIEDGASASARASYGSDLARRGRFADAQAQCNAAENLEPLGVAPRFCQFYIAYYQRHLGEAREVLRGALELNRELIYAHTLLGRIDLAEKKCPEAAAELDRAAAKLGPPAPALASAYVFACRGDGVRARAALSQAASAAPPAPFADLALGYSILGDRHAALANLEQAAAHHEILDTMLVDPAFDGIRGDARFAALEKKAGLVR